MTTRHLVDPSLLPGIARPLTKLSTIEVAALPSFRAGLRKFFALSPNLPETVVRREIEIPGIGDNPPVRALLYQPATSREPAGAVLSIHGGGHVIGAPEMNDAQNVAWCEHLNLVIVSIDYRLAPEAPHPASLYDCYAGLAYLIEHANELKLQSRPIGVAGESAGGGLAAALAIFARDHGQSPIAFQLLIYPMLDDRSGSLNPPGTMTGEFIVTPEDNRFFWRCLLGTDPGGPNVSFLAAPARCPDLAGLPPTFIAVGELDLFRDENMAYAQRLLSAGVSTELHVYPGAYHGFHIVPNSTPARRLEEDCLQALQRWLRA